MTEIEKLIVSYKDGEIEIMGNRLGLKNFGETCFALSRLGDEEAKTAANHYHFAESMNNAEEGSVPMLITLNLKL
jgi:hypothetical protein